jgi:hypothetical protein
LAKLSCLIDIKGGAFYGNNIKNHNVAIIVIRINKADQIVNARPCINCLNMMKACNIKKVYYSISNDELICEKVSNMVSIHVSATTRQYTMDKNINIKYYYEKILKTYFPQTIRKENLELFIKHNLLHVMPTCNIIIKNMVVTIYNDNNQRILCAQIF